MFDGLINNLKIKTKISLLSVIPTFFVLINFIYLVLFQYLSYKESSRLEVYVNAVNVLDQTANNFAVERGLTAGYLASGGKKRDRVLAQGKMRIYPKFNSLHIQMNSVMIYLSLLKSLLTIKEVSNQLNFFKLKRAIRR